MDDNSTKLAADATLSTIRAMHARYEANALEYRATDAADTKLGKSLPDTMLRYHYVEAMKTSSVEQDALRTAILFQVPDSWVDALILQYHIYVQQDLNANGNPSDTDALALSTALETLFDFMACEISTDHEQIGSDFKAGTMRVWERRRFRTGKVEA